MIEDSMNDLGFLLLYLFEKESMKVIEVQKQSMELTDFENKMTLSNLKSGSPGVNESGSNASLSSRESQVIDINLLKEINREIAMYDNENSLAEVLVFNLKANQLFLVGIYLLGETTLARHTT